jgi:hypothetical protein
MADVTIRPSKNGPYIVEGPVELFDTETAKGNTRLINCNPVSLVAGGSIEETIASERRRPGL